MTARAAIQDARSARTVTPRDDNRQPGRLLLEIHGRRIDIELRPDPRDVRMWRAYRDGTPWMRSGMERIWRALQSEIPPCVGRRHWA